MPHPARVVTRRSRRPPRARGPESERVPSAIVDPPEDWPNERLVQHVGERQEGAESTEPSVIATVQPWDTDVLMGRGRGNMDHIGNQHFYSLIDMYMTPYHTSSSRYEKTKMIYDIVVEVRRMHGRFLTYDKDLHGWIEIDENKARAKVGQALRYRKSKGASLEPSFHEEHAHIAHTMAVSALAHQHVDYVEVSFGHPSDFGGGVSRRRRVSSSTDSSGPPHRHPSAFRVYGGMPPGPWVAAPPPEEE